MLDKDNKADKNYDEDKKWIDSWIINRDTLPSFLKGISFSFSF